MKMRWNSQIYQTESSRRGGRLTGPHSRPILAVTVVVAGEDLAPVVVAGVDRHLADDLDSSPDLHLPTSLVETGT